MGVAPFFMPNSLLLSLINRDLYSREPHRHIHSLKLSHANGGSPEARHHARAIYTPGSIRLTFRRYHKIGQQCILRSKVAT